MATLFTINVTTETLVKNMSREEAFEIIKAIEKDVCELDFTIKVRDYCNKIIAEEEEHEEKDTRGNKEDMQ